jgi:ABC-2 type transport system permease protein
MMASRATNPAAIAVVARREMRDLWLRGRGLPLMLAFSLLMSVASYATATNRQLNFLEQREALNLTLQIAVAVGALLVLIAASDALSGERDRGTLESLLVMPVPPVTIVVGKGIASLSLWFGAYLCAVPYLAYLARGTRVTTAALVGGLAVGTLLSLFAAAVGLAISTLASTSRASVSIGLFLLIALFAPTQLPTSARQAWFGDMLLHVNPFTAGLRYLARLVIDGHGPTEDLGWIAGPIGAAALSVVVAGGLGARLALNGGVRR